MFYRCIGGTCGKLLAVRCVYIIMVEYCNVVHSMCIVQCSVNALNVRGGVVQCTTCALGGAVQCFASALNVDVHVAD